MTREEFINEFDILYNNASNQAPGLDEYEKSVLLTKALKQIVLGYLNPIKNKIQQGYDTYPTRQVDFSNLTVLKTLLKTGEHLTPALAFLKDRDNLEVYIKVGDHISSATVSVDSYYGSHGNVESVCNEGLWISATFQVAKYYDNDSDTPIDPVVVKLEATDGDVTDGFCFWVDLKRDININPWLFDSDNLTGNTVAPDNLLDELNIVDCKVMFKYNILDTLDDRGVLFEAPQDDILCVLNENLICSNGDDIRRIVVEPVNYLEYRRLMNKPFKCPLKNQAWRLIHSKNNNVVYEIVCPYSEDIVKYTIRYVRTPMPIILRDLTASGDSSLSIEGYKGNESFYANGNCCELPETLHEPILQRAVELAKAIVANDLNSQVALGSASQTELGVVARGNNELSQ